MHNTLIIDDNSSCKFIKKSNNEFVIDKNLKIIKKVIFEKIIGKLMLPTTVI